MCPKPDSYWDRWAQRPGFILWATRPDPKKTLVRYAVVQEQPRQGLVWVRVIEHRGEIERSSGAFYNDMGGPWHPDAVVACLQAIRSKCSKVRRLCRT